MRLTSAHVSEVELHRMVTEASTIGLPPGKPWPRKLDVEKIGNGQPFVLSAVDDNKATYKQTAGIVTLVIFND